MGFTGLLSNFSRFCWKKNEISCEFDRNYIFYLYFFENCIDRYLRCEQVRNEFVFLIIISSLFCVSKTSKKRSINAINDTKNQNIRKVQNNNLIFNLVSVRIKFCSWKGMYWREGRGCRGPRVGYPSYCRV